MARSQGSSSRPSSVRAQPRGTADAGMAT
jgi:hypothetical protein